MILTHFSNNDFKFNAKRRYPKPILIEPKPKGLWLSDESDYGWHKWCTESNFSTNSMETVVDFQCDIKKWIHISTSEMLDKFAENYMQSHPSAETLNFINWTKVRKDYSGILISPYQWKSRLGKHWWYYGWDCASACVWDLSTIKMIGIAHHESPLRKVKP